MSLSIHPAVDQGVQKGADSFRGGMLRCTCITEPVEVRVAAQVAFNHVCGCTKCWKPKDALFAVVGVVPREKLSVRAHGDKLEVVDPAATIQRYACMVCGTHLFGRIENQQHAFYGLDFIHTELSKDLGWEGPGFAAFVSSIIESGTPPSKMNEVREALIDKGLPLYDCLSPTLMDLLAVQAAKAKGTYKES